nr:hypothetical protein [Pseudenhygromyxa sp. WMMC2535]
MRAQSEESEDDRDGDDEDDEDGGGEGGSDDEGEEGRGAGEGFDRLTHGFHAYPARMHPAVARVLLEQLHPGRRAEVLDPFCGSGTVAVEAMVAGWRSMSGDLDPLALRLARVKTDRRDAKSRARFLSTLEAVAAASTRRVRQRVDVRAALSAEERSWYEVHVLKELAGLLEEIRAVADERDRAALEMVFSAIVVKFSRQRSETAERASNKRIRKGLVTEFFLRKGRELAERWAALEQALPAKGSRPRFIQSDARRLPQTLSGEFRCDLVLCSPPYGGTYDYARHHARRHAWLGIRPRQLRAQEIGARRDLSRGEGAAARWDRQMLETLEALHTLMRDDAVAIFLVGDAEVGGRRVEADRQLERLAPKAELSFLAAASSPRPDWRGGRERREHLVALRR